MITQVELAREGGNRICWLQHSPYDGEILKVGYRVTLVDSDGWVVKQIFTTVPDGTILPPNALGAALLFIDEA